MQSDVATQVGVLDYFQRGGPVMWPMLLCSIAGLTVVFYKLVAFHRLRLDATAFTHGLMDRLHAGGAEGGLEHCRGHANPVVAVARATLKERGGRRELIREAAEDETRQQLARLESYLPVLSTVSTIAPLFGFLGTVTGMIRAFDAICAANYATPQLVASGISEALITTAFGLFIAIPISAAYSYLTARVRSFERDMDAVALHLLAELAPEGIGHAA